METTLPPQSARLAPRVAPGFLLALAGASVFLVVLSGFNFLDPDLFHEMALFREALREGSVPKVDHFAYTPTLSPVVHHEWGTGAVLYAVSRAGPAGLVALRYALAGAVAVIAARIARRRGADWICIAFLAPPAAVMASYGFGTVRAQGFTMLFCAILLLMLEKDRAGSRRWLLVWPVPYVIWLNMHGGFVAGLGILAAYGLEQLLVTRRIPWRLVILAPVLVLLLLINPYGIQYPQYLWYALRLSRHQIGEWGPVWTDGWAAVSIFAGAVVLFAYALYRVGWRRMPGWLIYLACAYLAFRHVRHLSLLGLVALCFGPAWLQETPIGRVLERSRLRYPRAFASVAAAIAVACLVVTAHKKPWRLRLPYTAEDARNKEPGMYPYGAVQYLKELHFRGNVMTPFTIGGFISWELYPAVKVSLDGRYEVAYPLAQVSQIVAFYKAEPGWRATLDRYPTDLVLVEESAPLAKPLAEQTRWHCVYRDGVFELFARPELSLPAVDRRGRAPVAVFP